MSNQPMITANWNGRWADYENAKQMQDALAEAYYAIQEIADKGGSFVRIDRDFAGSNSGEVRFVIKYKRSEI